MKYIVTALGPIDMHAPGADVTGVYKPDVLQRLIDEGYIAENKPKPRKRTQADTADEDGE